MVLALFAAGLGLRTALPAHMAVEHFDEGVYASNFFYSGEKGDEHYPDQHLYAPPLVPVLIEFTMLAFGPTNVPAMGVGIVAGSLTIVLVWWVGRRWFGPTAGMVAATLATLSDVHVLFSRTALTDVLLCLFLIAAVHCFWAAQTTCSRVAVIASGAFTGLAWWTKYNGWLALAIGLAGVVAWWLVRFWSDFRAIKDTRQSNGSLTPSLMRPLLIWSCVAIVALAVWGPFWWSLQAKGGYSAVAANHRGYLVGFSGWGASFAAQARKLSLLGGPLTGCSPLVAVVLSLWQLRAADSRFTWNALLRSDVTYVAVPVLALLCVIEGGAVILAFLGIVGTGVAVTRTVVSGGPEGASPDRGLAAWLLAVWLVGLLVSVPLYWPYPRLVLPLLMASWLGLGVLADAVIRAISTRETTADNLTKVPMLAHRRSGDHALSRRKPILLLALGIGIAVAVTQQPPWKNGLVGWQHRAGLANLVPEIRDDIVRNAGVEFPTGLDSFVIYTYGEPALFFQLRQSGCAFVKPVKDLTFAYPDARTPPLPSYVAFGTQAGRTPGFGEQLAKALPRLQLIGKYRYAPSDVVMLDDPLNLFDRRWEYAIDVYLIK
jgi:hypothetical protein